MTNYEAQAHIITGCLLTAYFNRQKLLTALFGKETCPDLDEFELYCATYEAAYEYTSAVK